MRLVHIYRFQSEEQCFLIHRLLMINIQIQLLDYFTIKNHFRDFCYFDEYYL